MKPYSGIFMLAVVTLARAVTKEAEGEHAATAAVLGSPCLDAICEFQMTLTMGHTLTRVGLDGTAEELLVHAGGCLRPRGPAMEMEAEAAGTETAEAKCLQLGPGEASSRVITGDGRRRSVLLVNGQFPGPTLEVAEGATIIVHVVNQLSAASTAIHWHGLTMADSQWMDGTAFITQCPIPPGHTFTYRFVATPSGTHWYHPHLASMRRDGHFGLIVVHESRPTIAEYPFILSDWYEADGLGERLSDFRNGFIGSLPNPVSSLINGRGRHKEHPDAPLSRFLVVEGRKYRFRCMSASSELGYGVSVDQHVLTIVAWDGAEILPIEVDSFNIFPGERVDFEIVGKKGVNSSWIRAVSLSHGGGHGTSAGLSQGEGHLEDEGVEEPGEAIGDVALGNKTQLGTPLGEGHLGMDMRKGQGHQGMDMGKGKGHQRMNMGTAEDFASMAGLMYDSSPYPSSSPTPCTETHKCRIFNCFRFYVGRATIDCVDLAQIQSVPSHYLDSILEKNPTRNIFLNSATNIGTSINSLRFVEPLAPFFHSYSQSLINCKETCSTATRDCWCSQKLVVAHDEVVDLIMSNMESSEHTPRGAHAGHTTGHPMHLHGYHFALIAQGFASYNDRSGMKESDNQTILCESPYCRTPKWNSKYQMPRFHLSNPPLKDTVLVPPGGFVVVRLRANNPGCWFFHCHMVKDMVDGMAMYMEVEAWRVKAPPSQLPSCSLSTNDVLSRPRCNSTVSTSKPRDLSTPTPKWTITLTTLELICLVIGSVAAGLMVFVILLFVTRWCNLRTWMNDADGSKR